MSDFDLYESEIEELYRPKEEPKVVLTVEEAERLVGKAWLDMQGFACDELLRDIEERIEKAKGKK